MLFKANPEKFELVDARRVADDSWAHLAVTKDRVFVRDLNALKVFKWKLPVQVRGIEVSANQ